MILTSPSFENGAAIPKKFTCDGGEMNPELQIQNVPEDAVTLALVMHDPDAPITRGFTHWVMWNIDPKTVLIKEESVPPGAIEGSNSAHAAQYAGPCPSHGPAMHHYYFKLFALDIAPCLPKTSGLQELEAAMAGHILAETELMGTYERK
jgi:Raf kinase inhibitor-like YbhB/YbcL family protein